MIIRIDDPADPRIAPFVSIRERDLTRGENKFIAEGTVVLSLLTGERAARNGFRAESILLLENRLAGLSDILERVDTDVPVYSASQTVLDAIAGFHLHRGVLALGVRTVAPSGDEILDGLGERALVLAACGISNHDNLGSMFRNAAAFGVDGVLLDETCCDPLYRKALRVSVGSVMSTPYYRGGNIRQMISGLHHRGFALWGLSPRGQIEIGSLAPSPRMALLAGSEGEGLPPEIMAIIGTAKIAQSDDLDSLNVATATGIALYTVASQMGKI